MKNRILNITERLRRSTNDENIFWKNAYKFLENLTEDGTHYRNTEFVAKFLLSCLLAYPTSDFIIIAQVLRRYAVYCESSLLLNPDYLNTCLRMIYRQTTYLLSSGYTDNIIYYKDEVNPLDSMHLAIESTDLDFSLSLVKYNFYSRKKIRLFELKTILSSFLQTW